MGTRFWEFYLIRYLSGTIFAIVIMAYLIHNQPHQLNKLFYNDAMEYKKGSEVDIVKDLNHFLFTKNVIVNPTSDINVETKRTSELGIVEVESKIDNAQTIVTTELTVLSAIIIAVLGFLYMYVSSMPVLLLHTFRVFIYGKVELDESKKYHSFYRKLAGLRQLGENTSQITQTNQSTSQPTNVSKHLYIKDYVESYRHLREHGNAFGIMICEIIFMFVLMSGLKFLIVLWILAGFTSWFVASYLEAKMVKTTSIT